MVLSNTKPILDKYIKDLLLENKITLTLNHEEDLKSIHDNESHVFVPLLHFCGIMEEEKEAALHVLSENNGDYSLASF